MVWISMRIYRKRASRFWRRCTCRWSVSEVDLQSNRFNLSCVSRTQAIHTGFPVIGNGIDTQRMQVQLDEREPFAVAMSHAASNVALDKMNFVTQRVQGSEQPAQQ